MKLKLSVKSHTEEVIGLVWIFYPSFDPYDGHVHNKKQIFLLCLFSSCTSEILTAGQKYLPVETESSFTERYSEWKYVLLQKTESVFAWSTDLEQWGVSKPQHVHFNSMFSFTQLPSPLGLLKLSNIYLSIWAQVQGLPCTKTSLPQEPADDVRHSPPSKPWGFNKTSTIEKPEHVLGFVRIP